MAENVYVTNNLYDVRFSRFQVVDWINKRCCGAYRINGVEELGNGEIYCYLMNKLYPRMLNTKRVRRHPKNEIERLNNFKLLQEVFSALKVDMVTPIEGIAKQHFKPNFEFCQWFIRFYEKNLRPVAVRSTTEPLFSVAANSTYKNSRHFKRSISHLSGTSRRIMVRKHTKVTETTTMYEMEPESSRDRSNIGFDSSLFEQSFNQEPGSEFQYQYTDSFSECPNDNVSGFLETSEAAPPTPRERLLKNIKSEEYKKSDLNLNLNLGTARSKHTDMASSSTSKISTANRKIVPDDTILNSNLDATHSKHDRIGSSTTFKMSSEPLPPLKKTPSYRFTPEGITLDSVSLAAYPILSLLIQLLEKSNLEEFNELAIMGLRHIPPVLAVLRDEIEIRGKLSTPQSSNTSIHCNVESVVDNLKVLFRKKHESLSNIIHGLKGNYALTSESQESLNLLYELLQAVNQSKMTSGDS